MDGALPVAKRTRSRKDEMFRKMHEDFKKQRRNQEQTGDLGLGSKNVAYVVLDDVDEHVLVDEKDVVVETECITIEDSDEDEEEVDEDDDSSDDDDDSSYDDEEEGEEYVTDNKNGEESEDDMIDQGGMNEGGKNEGFPKGADGVIGDEQDRGRNIIVAVDPEENEGRLANEVVKPDLVFGNGGTENPTKDTNEIIDENVPVGEKDVVVETECITIEDSEEDNDDSKKDEEEVDEDDDSSEDDDENQDSLANGEVKPNGKVGKKKRGLTGTNDLDSNKDEDSNEDDSSEDDDDDEENEDRLANNKSYLGNRMDKSMGMIFMCNSKTKKDCYRHKVFGLPAGKKEMVLKITNGMKLFLFNSDLKLLYGIYKAAGPGGYNIEPTAFGCGFPSQVRFEVSEDCVPLPEEKFKRVIKDNYYQKNKFDFQLTSEQVKNLCKLFRATSKGSSRLHGIGKAETHALMDRGRNRNECYRERRADHRVEPYRNLDQDWMVRDRPHREVPYRNVDHDRRAREMYREQEEHHTSVRDILYEESRDPYKREVNASRMVGLPSRPRLSPVTATVSHPPSCAYEEEMNAYRR